MESKILLLFGMPRSGTTWIGKIFDSQRQVIYRHEPDSVSPLTSLPLICDCNDLQNQKKFSENLTQITDNLLHNPNEKVSCSLPIFPKDYFTTLQFLAYTGSSYLVKVFKKVLGTSPINPMIMLADTDQATTVWKSIESAGRIGAISKALDCKAILIVRHPCGHVSSVLDGESHGNFDANTSVANDLPLFKQLSQSKHLQHLRIPSIEDLNPVERITLRWLMINEAALDQAHDDKNILVVVYDEICSNPETWTQKMFSFSGLDLEKQTRDFLNESSHKNEGGYYSVYKSPLKAANKWKQSLDQKDIDQIKNIVRLGKYTPDLFPEASFSKNSTQP